MKMLNNINITGNIVKNAEIKITNKNNKEIGIITFTLANNNSYKNKDNDEYIDKTCFINCNIFGSLDGLKKFEQYLTKGVNITVLGELQYSQWIKQDKIFSKHTINVSKVFFNSRIKKNENNEEENSEMHTLEEVNNSIINEIPFLEGDK